MQSKAMTDAEFDRRATAIETIKSPARRERAKEALARRIVRDLRCDVESTNKVLRHFGKRVRLTVRGESKIRERRVAR